MIRALRTVLTILTLFGVFALVSNAYGAGNGQLDASQVSPIAIDLECPDLGGQLPNEAAASLNTIALLVGHELAINGCASAYRTLAQQWYLWNNCPFICAYPGTSNHGNEIPAAIDIPAWVQDILHSKGFGFSWRCCAVPGEAWHWEYVGGFNRPDPGPHLKRPVLTRGSGGPGQQSWVRNWQQLLRDHGHRGVTVDGIAGDDTCRANRRFERNHEVPQPDCTVTKVTWKALRGPTQKLLQRNTDVASVAGQVTGLDISAHNGSVNFKRIAGRHEFVISKVSEGGDYVDPLWGEKRMSSCHGADVVCGGYHYLRPRGDRPGKVEATWFVQQLRAAGWGFGDLRPVLDVEKTTLDAAGTCRYLHSAVQRIRSLTGVRPIIYTFPFFASDYLSDCGPWLSKTPLWIAHYGVSSPIVPAPWDNYAIWQSTSTGHSRGVSGNVDRNVIPDGRKQLGKLRYRPSKQTAAAAVGL